MDQVLAQKVALEFMQRHGLIEQEWRLVFQDMSHSCGQCNSEQRTILLQTRFTLGAGRFEFEQVVLHEIAHALRGYAQSWGGHDTEWRRICIKIGAWPSAVLWRKGHCNAWLNGPRFLEPVRADCGCFTTACRYIRDQLCAEQEHDNFFFFRTPRGLVGLWKSPRHHWCASERWTPNLYQ